ncbi:unnamed protein product [Amoebophrya sp. A120]|nr:unnamed protein product [Amoebophrya sp. A120]|eukprot:GSA120T00005531001.1
MDRASTDTRSRERLIKLCCNFSTVQRGDIENADQEINRVHALHKRRLDAAIQKITVAMRQVECAKRLYRDWGNPRDYTVTRMVEKLAAVIEEAKKNVSPREGGVAPDEGAAVQSGIMLDADRYFLGRLEYLMRLLTHETQFHDFLGENPQKKLHPIWDEGLLGLLSNAFGASANDADPEDEEDEEVDAAVLAGRAAAAAARRARINANFTPEERKFREGLEPFFPKRRKKEREIVVPAVDDDVNDPEVVGDAPAGKKGVAKNQRENSNEKGAKGAKNNKNGSATASGSKSNPQVDLQLQAAQNNVPRDGDGGAQQKGKAGAKGKGKKKGPPVNANNNPVIVERHDEVRETVPGRPGHGEGKGPGPQLVRQVYEYGLQNFERRLNVELKPAFQPFSFFCRTMKAFVPRHGMSKTRSADAQGDHQTAGGHQGEASNPPEALAAEDESIKFECPVCMDEAKPNGTQIAYECGEFAVSDIRLTPCGHAFCKACLEDSIKRYGKCPTCNNRNLKLTDLCDIANEAEGIRKMEAEIEQREQQRKKGSANKSTANKPKFVAKKVNLQEEHLQTSWGKLKLYNAEFGHEARHEERSAQRDKPLAYKKYGSKIQSMILVLQKILEDDPSAKCIVFAQWKLIEEKIESAFEGYKLPYTTLWGSGMRKAQILKDFQVTYKTGQVIPRGVPRILVMSFENNASGANLTSANHILFAHPMVATTFAKSLAYETQAIGRARRYGQKKTVHVWRFVTRDTVEAEVVIQHQLATEKRAAAKRELADRIQKKEKTAAGIKAPIRDADVAGAVSSSSGSSSENNGEELGAGGGSSSSSSSSFANTKKSTTGSGIILSNQLDLLDTDPAFGSASATRGGLGSSSLKNSSRLPGQLPTSNGASSSSARPPARKTNLLHSDEANQADDAHRDGDSKAAAEEDNDHPMENSVWGIIRKKLLEVSLGASVLVREIKSEAVSRGFTARDCDDVLAGYTNRGVIKRTLSFAGDGIKCELVDIPMV